MPILGIMASAISGNLSSYESIASASGTGSSATITFSSIPSTYKHLQLRLYAKTTTGSGQVLINFNGKNSGLPLSHHFGGNGATATAGSNASSTFAPILGISTGINATNPYVAIVDILDYADTNKFKTFRSLNGLDANGSGEIRLMSGFYNELTAVSSFVLTGPQNFSTDSRFALYGIEG
jgi:hypothetical protein